MGRAVKEGFKKPRLPKEPASLEEVLLKGHMKDAQQLMAERVRLSGWKQALSELLELFKTLFGNAWFARNRVLLSLMDCEELLGFDGDAEEVLSRIHDEHSLELVRAEAQDLLIDEVRHQLNSNGSTLFFDTGAMQSKRTAVLIPRLSAAREREFVNHARSFIDRYRGVWEDIDYWLETDDHLRYTYYGLTVLWSLFSHQGKVGPGVSLENETAALVIENALSGLSPAHPVSTPEAEEPVVSPSSRLRSLVDACFRLFTGLLPEEWSDWSLRNEFTDEYWYGHHRELEASRIGPSLETLFESGYLDAYCFAVSIMRAREGARLVVPPCIATVGVSQAAFWKHDDMSQVSDILFWAIKTLILTNHPMLRTVLQQAAPVLQDFEVGALIRKLDEQEETGFSAFGFEMVKAIALDIGLDRRAFHYSDVETIAIFLSKHLEQLTDDDRSRIADGILSRKYVERYQERTDFGGGLDDAPLVLVDSVEKSHRLALKIMPPSDLMKYAQRLLVGEESAHWGVDVYAEWIDTEAEDVLAAAGVDVIPLMTQFALREKEYPYCINLDIIQHVINKHRDSIDYVREALLNARTERWADEYFDRPVEPVSYDAHEYTVIGEKRIRKHYDKYEEDLIAILGEIGPFAILGEVVLWVLKELAEAQEFYAKQDSKKRSRPTPAPAYPDLSFGDFVQKRPDVVKVLGFLGALEDSELDDRILKSLRHGHPRPRAGACWYTWLKGTKSPEIIDELRRIVREVPEDKVALATLTKLTG